MPLVEYRCKDCGHVTEFLERAAEDREPACPKCGRADMRRVFSSFAARVAAPRPAARCETCPHDTCPMK